MRPPSDGTSAAAETVAAGSTRTLHCRLVAAGASRPETHLGDLPPVDLQGALGLTEPADSASSTLLLATLGGCLVERIKANAVIGGIMIRHLELKIEADMSTSPLWGGAGREPEAVGFEAIQVRVHIDAAAPEDALQAVVKHAMLWSPVANTLHAPIHLDVTLVPKMLS